jgi:uncharacterized protein with HEPN domain
LERISRRSAGIQSAADFTSTDEGLDRLDGICMLLIAVGEAFKAIDRKTEGLLARYPEIDWAGVKGVRDVIAHGYFDIDAEEILGICQTDIPALIRTVRKMIDDLSST